MSLDPAYRQAEDVLRAGGIVALPTDTVFGLITVAADEAAVERVYAVKGRDPRQPMPLFVASAEQAREIVETDAPLESLAAAFWPGPLTIVARVRTGYASRALAGGDSAGVRVPGDARIRALAVALGPLTGTSANIAGARECRTAGEVRQQLGERVDLVVDAPVEASGVPSSIVDVTEPGVARVLRDGAVSRGALAQALAGVAAVE